MSDLINRLREGCGCNFPETTCMAEDECRDAFEAAAEIERLQKIIEDTDDLQDTLDRQCEQYSAEVLRLTAALAEAREVIRPFANASKTMWIDDVDRAIQWLERNP